MQATIDIDVGGTFTDAFVTIGDKVIVAKTPTTPHDHGIAFRKVMEEAANELGISVEELLGGTIAIRYSTTIALNALLQRKGPKLGLITTAGHEHMLLIGRSRQWADGLHPRDWRYMYLMRKPEPLVPIETTVGVRERIDRSGQVIIPIDKEDVRQKVRYLTSQGVRGFAVCLLWSFANPVHEQVVKEVIQEEYPDPYLGNMPVLLSSEVQPKSCEYLRANVVILSAFLRTELADQLSAIREGLRERGYKGSLSICNHQGGVTRVSTVSAIDTVHAGPIAGLVGSAYVSKLYGLRKVLAASMGGTSFDYGIVLDGSVALYQDWPVIDRWATGKSMLDVATIGAGGGSIACLNKLMGNRLEVGPISAAANPGPACYGQGGTEPTVTDADIVLGYLNPDYFLGGKIKLYKEKAWEVMDKIAKPLGLTRIEAASQIRKVIDANQGNTLFHALAARGFNPSEFVVFAYGAAGPTHCAGYNRLLGASKILVFPWGTAFCAFGGATMGIKHSYETSKHISLYNLERPGRYYSDFEEFNQTVERLRQAALRDLKAEGCSSENVIWTLNLGMRYGGALMLTRVWSPSLYLNTEDDVKAICEAFFKTFVSRYTDLAAAPEAGINVENFDLLTTVALPEPNLPVFELGGESPRAALKGMRPVYWEYNDCSKETNIFDFDLLRPGNIVHGPAVIEAKHTTIVVPPGLKYSGDRYMVGTLESE